jgi:hypothetical protein
MSAPVARFFFLISIAVGYYIKVEVANVVVD